MNLINTNSYMYPINKKKNHHHLLSPLLIKLLKTMQRDFNWKNVQFFCFVIQFNSIHVTANINWFLFCLFDAFLYCVRCFLLA